MAFEFRDKTEDYVQFIKDGPGIHYKGMYRIKLCVCCTLNDKYFICC